VLVTAGTLLQPSIAHAGPASKVYLPQVVYGEWEFEFRGGFENRGTSEGGDEAQYVFDIGRGITPWWFSEIAVFYSDPQNGGASYEEFKSENIFMLTNPGEHWLDFGLIAEYVHNRIENVNEIELGPLFQKEVGHEQFNLALEFERELEDGAPTELTYAAQWKHRGNPRFELGLQAFGELGEVGHFGEEHNNRIGPAIFGQVPIGARNKLKYDAGLQFGLGRDAADTTFRFQLEYELYGAGM
jgi:hypothetical protein